MSSIKIPDEDYRDRWRWPRLGWFNLRWRVFRWPACPWGSTALGARCELRKGHPGSHPLRWS